MALFDRIVSRLPPKLRRRLYSLRWTLRASFTPIELRRSLRVLRMIHADYYHESFPTVNAWLHLARLLFRLPWHHPCHLPPPPSEIMAYPDREYFYTHHPTLLDERLLPLWCWRDTAPLSFFRMYEGFCADHHEYIGYETEYFWYRNDPAWTPEMLPDPREFGELAAGEEGERQLAVLASLAEALAESFNWRYMRGFRRDGNHDHTVMDRPIIYVPVFKGPAWAASVPRLPELFELHPLDPDWKALGEDNVVDYTAAQREIWQLRDQTSSYEAYLHA